MENKLKTLPVARREKILAWLEEEGMLSIQELQSRLNVSHMTVHRDLDRLDDQRLVRKVRGGVMGIHGRERHPPDLMHCTMCGSKVSARTQVVIQKQDGSRLFACCPHCGIMLLLDGTDTESALVRDYIYGRMVNIFQAIYIVESEVRLCCVPSILGFAGISDAQRFQCGFGGQLLNFSEALQHLAETHHQ